VKLIVALLIAASVLLPLTTETSAHSGTWYVSKSNGTYLRTCPSTSCGKVALLLKWTEVTATKHRGNWAYVRFDDLGGWVSLNVIRPVVSAPAAPVSSGAETCFWDTWGSTVCAEQWVADAVWNAAAYYGVSYWTMMTLAACESGFYIYEVSWAGAIGLFQFLPDTFYDFSNGDVWSVHDQSHAAALAISQGYGWYWDCWERI
jgi:hypothetical protein